LRDCCVSGIVGQKRFRLEIPAAQAKQFPMWMRNEFPQRAGSDQISAGVWSYITDINRRRVFAFDEEMGLVLAYSMFVHDGTPKMIKIIGVPGITERPNNYGAFNLPAAHIFKIRNGKIYEIEAIGYRAKYGIKKGRE
jgi:hypothetical protein